jgi:hypothetical protein
VNDESSDRLTPAEERLLRLLTLLRSEAHGAHASLEDAVMRRVRLQLLARHIGRAVADIAGAVADGVALIFGLRPRGKEKRS